MLKCRNKHVYISLCITSGRRHGNVTFWFVDYGFEASSSSVLHWNMMTLWRESLSNVCSPRRNINIGLQREASLFRPDLVSRVEIFLSYLIIIKCEFWLMSRVHRNLIHVKGYIFTMTQQFVWEDDGRRQSPRGGRGVCFPLLTLAAQSLYELLFFYYYYWLKH